MAKLLVGWNNYSTCDDCAYHLNRDVTNTIFYILAGISVYPFLSQYTFYWWVWNICLIYCMSSHVHMLCFPPLLLFVMTYLISNLKGPNTANAFFYMWKKEHENDPHFHAHGNSLEEPEQRARDKRNKRKEKKTLDENKLNLLTEKEELLKSLSEETIKRNICDSRFSDWQSSKLLKLYLRKQLQKLSRLNFADKGRVTGWK